LRKLAAFSGNHVQETGWALVQLNVGKRNPMNVVVRAEEVFADIVGKPKVKIAVG
jgi:hypothetical protein